MCGFICPTFVREFKREEDVSSPSPPGWRSWRRRSPPLAVDPLSPPRREVESVEGLSHGGGGPGSSLSLPRSEEEWVCMVRTLDHSQIPYFVENKSTRHTQWGGCGWVGWFSHTHLGRYLSYSHRASPVRWDKYIPPPLSVNRVGGLGFVWGAPSVVDMWGPGVTQSAPSGHFGSSGRPRSLTASPFDRFTVAVHPSRFGAPGSLPGEVP